MTTRAFHPLLANARLYHSLRQAATGGLPFRRWVGLYGLTDPAERIADIGCGPCDILRYVPREQRPAFYLGIDLSDTYLDAARARAARAGLDATFLVMDLERIPTDAARQDELLGHLGRHAITRVLLLGVLHHINDDAARATLDLIHHAPTVRTLVTQDVARVPGARFNNFLCGLDRGEHVRDEPGYDALAHASAWPRHVKTWTSPGLSAIRYLHYTFSKAPAAA